MSAKYFLFWLKGYIASKELNGDDLTKEDVNCILTALEMAIKGIAQGQGDQSDGSFSSNR